jgi:D-alanyl-D-alanine carboxypeptidase (penicillin-binding protein 5/6)
MLVVLLACMCSLVYLPAKAFASAIDSEPDLKEAEGAALIDSGGNVLYEFNAEEQFPPASTTKVMTAMVALDSGHKLDEIVDIVVDDLGEGGQLADYGDEDQIPLGELMEVMLVYSGNDAAYNTACYVAGSEEEFAKLMNEKAKAIGMTNTHFVNSHGMDVDDHYSCAKDLAIMGRYALQHYPFIANAVVKEDVETTVHGEQIVLSATDQLLGVFEGIRGVKSGAVGAGYTFVGASGRGGVQLYSGVIGCKTPMGRFDDTAALMEWGYENFTDRVVSHPERVTRWQPYAYDLGYKVPLSETREVQCSVWPDGADISSVSMMPHTNSLAQTNTVYGWLQWKQGERNIGLSLVKSAKRPERVSAWPQFSLPLFEEPETVGEELPDVK